MQRLDWTTLFSLMAAGIVAAFVFLLVIAATYKIEPSRGRNLALGVLWVMVLGALLTSCLSLNACFAGKG